jgi:hypothetical protein
MTPRMRYQVVIFGGNSKIYSTGYIESHVPVIGFVACMRHSWSR